MSLHDHINISNLYALYGDVGRTVNGSELLNYPHFQLVRSPRSAWPNIAYGLPEGTFDNTLTREIAEAMISRGMEPMAVASYAPDTLQAFKAAGFLPAGKWLGMYAEELDTVSAPAPVDELSLYIMKETRSLDPWIAVASRSLFRSKALDPAIFTTLRSTDKAELIGLEIRGELVGTAMVYYDGSGNAGLYFVCIGENYRGKGLGKPLVRFCLACILARGIKRCYLQSTKAGLNLYASLGFKSLSEYLLFLKIK